MILGGGLRVENNYLDGVKISQIDDMAYADEYTILYSYPAYYDNKIYVEANTLTHSAFQSLNISSGSWTNLTDYSTTLVCRGFIPSGSLIYGFYNGYPTTACMVVKSYNPSNNTWGTSASFAYTSASCATVCNLNNDAYVAYVYSLVGSTYTWHLFSYDINTNIKSSDLNFEITTTDSLISQSIVYGDSTMFFISGSQIYEYDPAVDSTSNVGTLPYILRYWKNCVYYNGKIYVYANYGGYNIGKIEIFDTTTHTSTQANINLPKNTVVMSVDPIGRLYCFGSVELISGSYITDGHTYVIEP
jgi:hypothetical protein